MTNFPNTFRQSLSTNLLTLTKFRELLRKVESYSPDCDRELLRRAYQFAAQHHANQRRQSGEPYLAHPLAVADILADLRLDLATIATALLHDVVEDTKVTTDEVRVHFGEEIAHLVEGVTKISKLEIISRKDRQAQNVRKMLLAMVDDLRVIFVKLADRLHNMRTLQHVSSDQKQRVAQETVDIYAPLAHRMGMGKIRGELEELSFLVLDPIAYSELQKDLAIKRRGGEEFLRDVTATVKEKLKEFGIQCELHWRIKRPYSIYQKLKRQEGTVVGQVYDLLALRIITDSIHDCYAALGIVHGLWQPLPGRIKDFIAMPRPNLYQSLHTTLMSKKGQPFEVQIRTSKMHRTADEGIAAHWHYKEAGGPMAATDEHSMAWLRQLVEWQRELSDPSEYLSNLKIDLYPEEVYSFTPKGKVVVLPRDATPVDFAYTVHTEVGDTCVGARVNGKMIPLRYRLNNGDIVEILTQKGTHPSRDWLTFVKSSKARNKIKHWLNVSERASSIELGKRLLEKECRRRDISWKSITREQLASTAETSGYQNIDDWYSAIGFGRIVTRQVLSRWFPGTGVAEVAERKTLAKTVQKAFGFASEGAIQVKGYEDLLVYRAKCCNPIRGEGIVGYITRGKGVAVHSENCPNVQNLLFESGRKIDVEWADSGEISYSVQLAIRTEDRPGLLKELTAALTTKTNIRNIETRSGEDTHAYIDITIDTTGKKHLEKLILAMRKVNGVNDVQRIYQV